MSDSSQQARKYTLTRLRKGDYLLLGNDGKTLWRIAVYWEDGSAVADGGRVIRGQFWATWKYKRPVTTGVNIDTQEWDDFECWDMLLRSRRDAIAAALKERT